MAKLDFVDTHVHFYDMQHPELFYWGGHVHRPDLDMQIQKLAEKNYLPEEDTEDEGDADSDGEAAEVTAEVEKTGDDAESSGDDSSEA